MTTYLRIKHGDTVGGAGSTSLTVTFDEGTPLDSTHLLVALVASDTTTATPSGWTLSAARTITSGRYVYVFTRQGDGSVNSITTVSGAFSAVRTTLLAFVGFTSTTALYSADSVSAVSESSYAFTAGAPSGSDGVCIAIIRVETGSKTPNSWSNSYESVTTAASPSFFDLVAAVHPYADDGANYNTTATFPTNNTIRLFTILPLGSSVVVSAALGADPVTLALGADAVTGVVGAEPA